MNTEKFLEDYIYEAYIELRKPKKVYALRFNNNQLSVGDLQNISYRYENDEPVELLLGTSGLSMHGNLGEISSDTILSVLRLSELYALPSGHLAIIEGDSALPGKDVCEILLINAVVIATFEYLPNTEWQKGYKRGRLEVWCEIGVVLVFIFIGYLLTL